MNNYILNDQGKPVLEPNILRWARWYESADRRVAWSDISQGVHVSTVFLGIDHNFGGGPPLLYETMVFGGPMDQHQERYTTREEAVAGHEEVVRRVKEIL